MKRCLFLLSLITVTLSEAQNLMPNPGFETFSSCPTALVQVNRATPWVQYTTGTSDYFNCSFYGDAFIGCAPNSGTGAVGALADANNTGRCPIGDGYVEYIAASLTSQITSGNTYDISVTVQVDGIGSLSGPPNNCLDFGFYFYPTSSPPSTANGSCAVLVTPQASFSTGLLLQGTYQTFNLSFTAAANYDEVLVGTFVNGNTAGCPTDVNRTYLNWDDVSVEQQASLNYNRIDFKGYSHDSGNQLEWKISDNQEYEYFNVEKSQDGNSFESIGRINVDNNSQTTFRYLDDQISSYITYYRLHSKIKNEGHKFHEVIKVTGEVDINLYPNPVRDQLNIKYTVDNSSVMRIEMIDPMGRTVYNEQINTMSGVGVHQIPMLGLSKGSYIVKVHLNGNTIQKLFLKK